MAWTRLPIVLFFTALSVWTHASILAAPGSQNAVLHGRVTDSDGVPLSGVFLSVSDRQGFELGNTQSDADGHYELSVPEAAAYKVWAGKTEEYLFQYIPETKEAENGTADFRLRPGANFVLVAYDSIGRRLNNGEMRRITMNRVFLTDLSDKRAIGAFTAVHSEYSGLKWDEAWPALIVVPGSRYKILVQWEMPQVGFLLFTLDNGGSGYQLRFAGDVLELDLNREIALSSLAELQRNAGASAVAAAIAQSRNDLLAGEAANRAVPPDRMAAFRAFSRSTKTSFEAREQLVLDVAASNIEKNRKGDIELTITNAKGVPLPGLVVDFQQTDNDFMFGAHPLGHAGRYEKRFGEKMREAGFNTSYITARWGRIEPSLGTFDWRDIDVHQTPLDKRQDGFRLLGALSLWLAPREDFVPRFLNVASFSALREAVRRYAFLLAQRYAGVVDVWEVNELNLKDINYYKLDWNQRIIIAQTFTGAIKAGNRWAEVMFSSLALGYDTPDSRSFSEMLDPVVLQADVIGIELYQAGVNTDGGRVIGLGLTAIDRLFDEYMKLGKPLLVKEFSVPSMQIEGSSWWHRKWDEDLQAEFASKVYAIAFSKRTMQGLVWAWGVDDAESFILSGGLLDRRGMPKKAYFVLQKLIGSWRTSGKVTTNAAGVAAWRGFGGTYRVIATLDGREVLDTSIQLAEQDHSKIFLRIEDEILGLRR